MSSHIQPSPLPAARQHPRWIKSVAAPLCAAAFAFSWAAGIHTRAQGVAPADSSPAVIIDNELQALGVSGGSVSARFSTATASQLESALTAAIDEWPGFNPVHTEDNPGYASGTYSPVDLTNYILDTATNNFSVSSNYKSIAATVVKDAITELQTVNNTWPTVYTNGIVEKITAGAAAILANRLPGDYVPTSGQSAAQIAAAKDSLVSSNIDTLLGNSIKLNPSDANGILQEIVNELQTPPSNPSVSGLSSVTMTQLQAVNAVATTFKAVPTTSLVTTASSAITSVGTFFTGVSGTFSANQSFLVAMIKDYSSTSYPTLAEVETAATVALVNNGAYGNVLTSSSGAAAYTAPIILNGISSAAIPGVVQAVAANISGVNNQAIYAALLTTGTGTTTGALSTKNTAAISGAVLGGVIANNPSMVGAYIMDSGIYTAINNTKSLSSSGNRISFVDAALSAVASSNTAITGILDDTILSLSSTNFVDEPAKSLGSDFQSLIAGATKAVSADPSGETAVVDALNSVFESKVVAGNGIYSSTTTAYQTFAAIAAKNAGTAGYEAYQEVLNDSALTQGSPTAMIAFSGTVAGTSTGTAAVNDTTRAQILIGLLNSVTSSSYASAYTTVATDLQATTPSGLATTIGTVLNAFSSNTSAFNSLAADAFTSTFSSSPSAGAGDLAKLIPLALTTNLATQAAAAQGSASVVAGSPNAAFSNDESILNAILAVSTVKANTAQATSVANAIAQKVISGDSVAADLATFAFGAIGNNLSSETAVISQGIAQAYASNGDANLETFASNLTTQLVGKNPNLVAQGVAAALNSGASSGTLAADITLAASQALSSGSTPSASLRGKVGASVAYSQPNYAATVVTDLINGNGVLMPISGVSNDTAVAIAVTAQAPSSSGTVAGAVAAFFATDPSGPADLGSVIASIAKSVPLTLSLSARTADIAAAVDDTIHFTTTGGAALSSTTNLINYLNKAAAAGANVGNLVSQEVATDMQSSGLGITYSTSNDSTALNSFLAAAGLKLGGNTVYVAEGFASYLSGVNPVTFAQNVAIASGTASSAAAVKETFAEGVALADPSGSPQIANVVSATVTDGFSAPTTPTSTQAKVENANNAIRTAIAVDVAKANPADALDVAYDVALQLDNPGTLDTTASTFGTFAKDIASAVDGVLPKQELGLQLGAIASEILLAAHQNANTLTPAQLALIIYDVASVKSGIAYDVVGASIATAATWMSGTTLSNFETTVENEFTNTTTNPIKTEAASAVGTYSSNSDAFDVGPVTQPETGVTNA
jgi:hypothetical protein